MTDTEQRNRALEKRRKLVLDQVQAIVASINAPPPDATGEGATRTEVENDGQ